MTNSALAPSRGFIFLSHATPQDNDFTIWLSARLASAGYAVWSDLTMLLGGECHWDSISEAIKLHSAKFVTICSKVSFTKTGWKDELSLALATERAKSLNDFVIPVRLDPIQWNDFPVEIIRRNGIDFNGAWHVGLARLLEKLNADAVPKSLTADATALSEWASDLLDINTGVLRESETLVSNILPATGGPKVVFVSALRSGAIASPTELMRWPVTRKRHIAYGFTPLSYKTDDAFVLESQIDFSQFISRGDSTRGINSTEAFNIATHHFRVLIDRALQAQGLIAAVFSGDRVAHFLPAPERTISPRTKYVDPWGETVSRALNGFSPKNNVFWHFSPEFIPQLGRTTSVILRSHVVFTEDGCTPLSDSARAHRLRRRFCKNWWQDRWRGMLLAFMSHLAQGKAAFEVPVSPTESLSLATVPELFVSPITANRDGYTPEDSDEELHVPDDVDLDDDEDDLS